MTLVAVVFAIVYLGMILGALAPEEAALFGPREDLEDLVRRFLAELGE